MIPFDQIDERLKKIGKDRNWLSEQTLYKPTYIRDILAPKSTRGTERVMRTMSDAIEAEEARQASIERVPPGYSKIFLSEEELDRADKASRIVGAPSLAEFCRNVIQAEARRIIADSHRGEKNAPEESRDQSPLALTPGKAAVQAYKESLRKQQEESR